MGDLIVRRSSFSARIAECWRRRRRRGSRLRMASSEERRTFGRTPNMQVRASFCALSRIDVVCERSERQMEPHSRTGWIQEKYRLRFVGMSALQVVSEIDLRTERNSVFPAESRT